MEPPYALDGPLPESAVADVALLYRPGLDEAPHGDRPSARPAPALPSAAPPRLPLTLRWIPTDDAAWAEREVTKDLAPVRWNYFTRLHLLTERSVAGRVANSAYNNVLNEADTHWRLMEATGRGLPLDSNTNERWLTAAESASLLGADQLLSETVARAPILAGVRDAADFVFSPSIDLAADRRGRVRLGHQTGGTVARQARQAEDDLMPGARGSFPRLSMGVGWQTVDPDARGEDLAVTWGAWVDAGNIGLSNLRGELSFADLSWSLTARRRLVPDLFLVASLRSVDTAPDIGRWSVGAQLQDVFSPRWSLRLDRAEAARSGEVTWSLTLRAELGARMPGRLDGGLAGLPDAPPIEPNTLDAWGAGLR